jgi:prepilin signal peptidase PulO-like enzyme (type II secretory pathway)
VLEPLWVALVVPVVFGAAAFLGIQLSAWQCRDHVPFPDGPRPIDPPIGLLVGAAAAVGLSLGFRGIPIPQVALFGMLTTALAAGAYADLRYGLLPDAWTLGPLAVVIAVGLLERNFGPLFSALVVFVPFAVAALLSKGVGMGWGDVKLVALGGAALGLQAAVLACAAASFAAYAVAFARRRTKEPIAFGPYLAAGIALAVAVPGAVV